MSMAVDEARHHHAAGSVDFDGIARRSQVFDAAGRPHFAQNPAGNKYGAVGNYAQLRQFGSATRSPRATQR